MNVKDVLRRAQTLRGGALERQLVWVLGSPRSGSTWLMHLLQEPPRVAALQEPLIGMHLGMFASSSIGMGEEALPAGVRLRDLRDDDLPPPDQRLLVRYEELLSDTATTLQSIYSWLDLDPPEGLLGRVQASSFDAVPALAKGSGRFHRAATPGLWRQNLSQEEQDCCTKIMGPTLTKMGYEAVPELSR